MAIKKKTYTDYEVELALREKEDYEAALHALMDVVGALEDHLESTVGGGGRAVGFIAGKKLGKKIASMLGKQPDIQSAIETLTREKGDSWKIELWKSEDDDKYVKETAEGKKTKLLFRDCIMRQTLERQGIPQKRTMCYLTNGYVCGALEVMLDKKVEIDFIHSGTNACLKELTVKEMEE